MAGVGLILSVLLIMGLLDQDSKRTLRGLLEQYTEQLLLVLLGESLADQNATREAVPEWAGSSARVLDG